MHYVVSVQYPSKDIISYYLMGVLLLAFLFLLRLFQLCHEALIWMCLPCCSDISYVPRSFERVPYGHTLTQEWGIVPHFNYFWTLSFKKIAAFSAPAMPISRSHQKQRVINPSVMTTTAVVLCNSIINCSACGGHVLSIRSTNSWCYLPWG